MTEKKLPAFGQADPTDSREPGEWKTRYTDPEARRWIAIEACYSALNLIAVPVAMVLFWKQVPKYWLHLSDEQYRPVLKYGLVWIAGVLGGTLFSLKWLYHTVARQYWHMDRRLWRFFTPQMSGGLAFGVFCLISSGIVRIFDVGATNSLTLDIGIGFLVGYFSDSAVAKLSEIADTLFGTSRARERHLQDDKEHLPNANS